MFSIGYCYHPLKGFYLGTKQNGKRNFMVTSSDVDHIEYDGEKYFKVFTDNIHHSGKLAFRKYIEIPCGRCIGCRLQRSREWANRMMMELQYHDQSTFLTLTYDDDHLHFFEGVQPETGEVIQTPGLVLKDLQDFIKRLRNKHRDIKIRYFACGEYGDKTQRPHYHLIIFGYTPPDKQFFRRVQDGKYNYYTSVELADLWPYGIHIAADVTWESCAYTSRYVTKKLYGDESEVYDLKNIIAPFCVMSTKPGLGYQWYVDHYDELQNEERKLFYLSTDKGSISFSKPRYFRKLDDIGYVIPADSNTLLRTVNYNSLQSLDLADDMSMQRAVLSMASDLEYLEQLKVDELNKSEQIKSLKRSVL